MAGGRERKGAPQLEKLGGLPARRGGGVPKHFGKPDRFYQTGFKLGLACDVIWW